MKRYRLPAGTRFGALHAASFVGLGVSMPFFPVWLQGRGLTSAEIGVILAVPPLVRIVAAPALMSLTDKGTQPKRLLTFGNAGVALAYTALMFAHDPFLIGALVILSAIASASIVPATDLVTLQAIRHHPGLDYGRVRLWGSLAFLAANVAAGYLFAVLPVDGLGWVLAVLGLGSLAITGSMVSATVPPANLGEILPTSAQAKPRLSGQLWMVIAAAALAQASHAAIYAFGSLHWRGVGYSSEVIGYLWAIGVVAEIVIFAAFGRHVGRSVSALRLLAIGAAAGVLRFGVMSCDPPLAMTFALQLLHGISFGATHLGTMGALALLAPAAARGRAQGLMSSSQAIVMAGATALSGAVFRAAGPFVFLAMVPLAAAGLGLAIVVLWSLPRQPQRKAGGG